MAHDEPRKISETIARQIAYARDTIASTARAQAAMEPKHDPDRVPRATELQVTYARRFHKVQGD